MKLCYLLTIAKDEDCFAAEEGAEGDGKAVELDHDKPAMRMVMMMKKKKMIVIHVTLQCFLHHFGNEL